MSGALDTEEATSKLQRKLEELHLPQRQHVILPNHIIVPDSEKNKFCFGSLGVNFGVNAISYVSGPDSEKSSTLLSETSQDIEESVEEQNSRFVMFNYMRWESSLCRTRNPILMNSI